MLMRKAENSVVLHIQSEGDFAKIVGFVPLRLLHNHHRLLRVPMAERGAPPSPSMEPARKNAAPPTSTQSLDVAARSPWPSATRMLPRGRAALLVVLLGALFYAYQEDVIRWATRARRSVGYQLFFRDSRCEALRVLRTCEREELVKVLFVVDSKPKNAKRRRFARRSYARRSFASPLKWLTVFRMRGNKTEDELESLVRDECKTAGDMVVPRGPHAEIAAEPGSRKLAPTFLPFVSWILEKCPNVDLVVHMHDAVLPHPFYLPNYRVLHMDHQPQVIHCHSTGFTTAECNDSSVLMTKKQGIEALARNASEQEGLMVTGNLEVKNMASYIAVNETMTMLYTIGAVLFYTYPPNLNVSMMSLWEEMMAAPENSPHYLYL
ncbi:uncharacterized protein [Dermacentor albipictus]|uniref:uncharacterized protein isoform X2 n=1 Tax=Dermacentor albipictus TaxID=60249 RepID=UPI0038FCC046